MSIVRHRKGQAIVLVTLALFAMVGLMGLAIDIGWSFYIEKTSQAAADSAATAAVIEVLKIGGKTGPYGPGESRTNDAGGTVTIPPNSPTVRYTCPNTVPNAIAGDNYYSRDVACMYALRNGFGAGANSQTNVDITYGNIDTTPVPEAPDVTPVYYWTTAYVAQTVPQLFSSILGNTEGLVASKATAAIVDSELTGSLWLLNRTFDGNPMRGGNPSSTDGVDLLVQANDNSNCPQGETCDSPPAMRVAGGVIAASEAHGATGDWRQDPAALMAFGGATVEAEYFALRGQGGYYEGNNATFSPKPTNGFPNSVFEDPTTGLPNPPLPDPSQLPVHVMFTGGVIPGGPDEANATPLLPGIYAAAVQNGGQNVLTGNPIKLGGGYYKFVDASGTTQNGFSNYTFVGGLEVFGGSQVSVGPGQYVMMGAKPVSGEPGVVFSLGDGSGMSDGLTAGDVAPSGNAGQIFVLAGPSYTSSNGVTANEYVARAAAAYSATNATTSAQLGLGYGTTRLQLGNNGLLNIHGLNPDVSTPLDQNGTLAGHRRFVMWQDRSNSMIQYDVNGEIVLQNPCPATPCPDPLDYPEGNPDPLFDGTGKSTELRIQASPSGRFYGVVYQPRGAYTYMQGGGGYDGPLQLVTGAFRLQGGTNLNMGVLSSPLTQRIVALIQ